MNEGKQFEKNFKASVPPDIYFLRLHDSSIGFDIKNSTQQFALQSPYDCILYKKPNMYCLELKSTQSSSFSYQGNTPMIKEHQIKNLIYASGFCKAGFIFNFRTNENTYYVPIDAFNTFIKDTSKKSLNEKDIATIGIPIPSRKLKVNYRYNLEVLF